MQLKKFYKMIAAEMQPSLPVLDSGVGTQLDFTCHPTLEKFIQLINPNTVSVMLS